MNSHEMFKKYVADIGLTKVQYEAVCDLHKACFESHFTPQKIPMKMKGPQFLQAQEDQMAHSDNNSNDLINRTKYDDDMVGMVRSNIGTGILADGGAETAWHTNTHGYTGGDIQMAYGETANDSEGSCRESNVGGKQKPIDYGTVSQDGDDVAFSTVHVYGDDSEGSCGEANVANSNTPTVKTGNPVIRRIQAYLNNTYKSGLKVDGLYGPRTSNALLFEMKREKNPQRMESLRKMWNDVRTLMEKKKNNKNLNKNSSIASNQQN